MANPLTGAALYANNENIPYIPNSLVYDLGTAERVVTSQVIGNGATVNVATENYETAKGMIKFDLKSTSENEAFVLTWISNFDANVFKVVSSDGRARIFQSATVINKPEFDTGSDGVISVEIESAPVAVG